MKKRFSLLFVCLVAISNLNAQRFYLSKAAFSDSVEFARSMPLLAQQIISKYKGEDERNYLSNLFRLQILGGEYASADSTIVYVRSKFPEIDPKFPELIYIQHEIFARAKLRQAVTNSSFDDAFAHEFRQLFSRLDDKSALYLYTAFITRNGVKELEIGVQRTLSNLQGKDSLSLQQAIDLCRSFYVYQLYKHIESPAKQLFTEDGNRRYQIDDSVTIKTKDGATLSAVVVRKKGIHTPQPSALFFTIYSDLDQNLIEAKQSAARDFIGVVVDTRGKRLSPDPIEPYEHEGKDVNSAIDWIVRQPWSNGKVGMYGGSYTGFAQWAATKNLHPALKTIVPYVAAIPGIGLPMENNIFLSANYGWAFYVTNNKYLDNEVYFDPRRWDNMQEGWYKSGRPYRKLDSIDGAPNKWLQRWLMHPAYDKFWQSKVPYKNEYAKINIPVLTITGYYDDGQISAIHYLKQHYKYNPNANHYLIIGPYDHFGAQRGGTPILRDYMVDSVSLIDTRQITYEWLDYILRDKEKPKILKDKINYEVMGANEWKHAASIAKMSDTVLTFYLSDVKPDSNYQLATKKGKSRRYVEQEIDLADRSTTNNDYYPYPIIRNELDRTNGLFFISEPFTETVSISGTFSGELKFSINKKDMDIGIVFYELMPDGRYFHLSYFLGRASYAKDETKRQLLTPGKIESIPFDRTRMVSRQLSKGSRLMIVLNINKNSFAQVNYGTGKDVSDESIEDAKEPLKIKWYNDSSVKIPVSYQKQ